jgi:hypothetical protein
MARAWVLAWSLGLALTSTAVGQTSWQFRAPAGQVLNYRMEHSTSVTEVTGGNTVTAKSKVNAVKRWRSLGTVEGKAGFRLELSFPALRVENTTPSGEVLLFDSSNLDKSTPELRAQITHVGKPVAVLRVDPTGKVVEVIECKQGPASVFESDPPFDCVLPAAALTAGKSWERTYQITLAPPQGTNEKYDAVQKYVVKAVKDGKATIGVTTGIPKSPASPLDRIPLLQKLWEGEIDFDIEAGRLLATRFKIDQEVKNHQGEGSSYRFQSAYTVQFVGEK